MSECLGTAVNGLPNINPETRLGIETRETSLDTILEFFTIETFETRETCLMIDVGRPVNYSAQTLRHCNVFSPLLDEEM